MMWSEMFRRGSFRDVRDDIEKKIKEDVSSSQEIGIKVDSLKTNRLYLGRLDMDGGKFSIKGKRYGYIKSVLDELPEEIRDLELLEKSGYDLLDSNFLERLYLENEKKGRVFVDYHISRNGNYEAVCTHPQISTLHEDKMICSDFLDYNGRSKEIWLKPSYLYSPRIGQKKFMKTEKTYECKDLDNFINFSKKLNSFFFAKSMKSLESNDGLV